MRRVWLGVLLIAVTTTAGPAPNAGAATPITNTHVLAIGWGYTCAATSAGSVRCWGANTQGALGSGAPFRSIVPLTVAGVTNVRSIAAGVVPCALLRSGTVECWGQGDKGERGDGRAAGEGTSAPTPVSGITTAVGLAVSDHACAVLANGTVMCWGPNDKGQLGNGAFGAPSTVPVEVTGITNAIAVSTGSQMSCALLADRTVRCWGIDAHGALGTGGPALGKSTTPVVVRGIADVVELTTNSLTTCARLRNGNVMCWGANLSGELGDGTRNYGRHPEPVKVQKVGHAVDVSNGSAGCVALADGSVKCWGSDYFGTIGDGRLVSTQTTAVTVQRVTGAVAVASGTLLACAVLADGRVRCWGQNDHGELGTGAVGGSPSKAVFVKGLALGKQQ